MSKKGPGRPALGVRPVRLSLDQATIDRLEKINSNISAAVRTAAQFYEETKMSTVYPPINAKIWSKKEDVINEEKCEIEIKEDFYFSPYPGRCHDIEVPDWMLENGAVGEIQWHYSERRGASGELRKPGTTRRDIDVGHHSYPGVLVQNQNGVLVQIENK